MSGWQVEEEIPTSIAPETVSMHPSVEGHWIPRESHFFVVSRAGGKHCFAILTVPLGSEQESVGICMWRLRLF